jgi:uncharacterized RDD family membrane protein YckC
VLDRILDRFQPSKKRPTPAMDTVDDRGILGQRAAAVAIDLAICYFLIEAPLLYVLDVTMRSRVDALGGVVLASAILLVPLYLTYSFGFEWRYGRTPGKVNRGLMVAMADGGPCTARASAVRNMLRYVDFLGVPPLVVGLVAAYTTDGRRVGDLAADTVVVRTRVEDPEDQAARADLETDAAARSDEGEAA